ncbi:hypothetical protein [Moorena producens]|uniref:hypothetical protein n=1 Tax=Moorena producens TaxID=1155739 RepID=UPI003C71E7A6
MGSVSSTGFFSLFPLTCSLLPAPCSLKTRYLYFTSIKIAIYSIVVVYYFFERLSEKSHLLHPSPLNPPILGDF